MKSLNIAKEISLPLDLVTQTIAILAKRRVGKSYTMRRISEQLLDAGQQVVLVDPKGDQWGIRSSADGKGPGYPIVILGGEHGDIPLEVNGGELVAKLVVEERVSVLLDLSIFRKHEIATFMAIFLENLYRLKAQEAHRTPVMLVVDEADAIAPQKPQRGEERMLGAIEDVVRRGGQRGIGCILVTQRSAVLNKNVLTQAQMLIVLRTIAPQDLSAMKAWIDVHGTLEEGKELMESLPSLPIGDAWFWSPGWPSDIGIFKRAHVLPITTFDSAATPKPGEKKITPKNLADVDMESLKKQMSETIEKAKDNDPKILRKRISQLEQELQTDKPVTTIDVNFRVEKAVKNAVYETDKKWQKLVNQWEKSFNDLNSIIETLHAKVNNIQRPDKFPIGYSSVSSEFEPIHGKITAKVEVKEAKNWIGSIGDEGIKPLSKASKLILSYLHSVFPAEKTKTQLWIATGYAPGGGFDNQVYALGELIQKVNGKYRASHENYDATLIDDSFNFSYEKWFLKLGTCSRRIFMELLKDPSTPLTKNQLAQILGYALGGGFDNQIYRLTGPELIKKVPDGYIINPEILDL